jgi:hypothetical protein
MSRRILFVIFNFSLFVFVVSCNENSAIVISKPATEKDLVIAAETLDTIPKKEQKELLFEKLVHRMDSLGFDPDTTYFDETMYLEEPFHYANYETYFIHELLMDEGNYGDLISVEFKKEYDERFSRVKDIKLYPWRMPNTAKGRMRNGVVELWTFENTTDAEYVFEFLENELNHLGFPFIKTRPYYFQCDKWVYMFHSPDSGVSYRHQQFYDWIKKQCK